MTMGKYDGELQHSHPERIEEARKRCNLCHLVIAKRTYFNEFEEICAVNYMNTHGSGAGSHCGPLTKHSGDSCPRDKGEETQPTDWEMANKKWAINSFKNEFYSAVRWWGKPDPEENG